MAFQTKNKIDANFNLSSMTDMIFLLLVFFMLTSNVVTPSGLPINTPTSKGSQKVIPKVNISITKNLDYYVNDTKVPVKNIESELKVFLEKEKEGVVVLNVDKDVPIQYVVEVAGIAKELGAKISITTKPAKKK